MTTDQQLKACKCGANVNIFKIMIGNTLELSKAYYQVICEKKWCVRTDRYTTKEEAIEAWNRRV